MRKATEPASNHGVKYEILILGRNELHDARPQMFQVEHVLCRCTSEYILVVSESELTHFLGRV